MKLRFFGRLRDLAADGALEVDPPADVTTTEALRSCLGATYPSLCDPAVRIAIDDRLVQGDEPLGDAKEIAFLPPVSGG